VRSYLIEIVAKPFSHLAAKRQRRYRAWGILWPRSSAHTDHGVTAHYIQPTSNGSGGRVSGIAFCAKSAQFSRNRGKNRDIGWLFGQSVYDSRDRFENANL